MKCKKSVFIIMTIPTFQYPMESIRQAAPTNIQKSSSHHTKSSKILPFESIENQYQAEPFFEKTVKPQSILPIDTSEKDILPQAAIDNNNNNNKASRSNSKTSTILPEEQIINQVQVNKESLQKNIKRSSILPFDQATQAAENLQNSIEATVENNLENRSVTNTPTQNSKPSTPELSTMPEQLPITKEISLYDAEIASIVKGQRRSSILGSLTGSKIYQQGDQTISINNLHGTITFKNAQGQTIKKIKKYKDGITQEITYQESKINQNGKTGTIMTTTEIIYANQNRLGKRTEFTTIEKNIINEEGLRIITKQKTIQNYDVDNKLLSSMDPHKSITIYGSEQEAPITVSPDNFITQRRTVTRSFGSYDRALEKFTSDQVKFQNGWNL